ncbi:MAG: hypothetical protein D6709_13060 [Chloroflexi bacterium]|uniref:Uncharacterized protein n=1 Tax=Candidatus Thermofonsia Clade 3 bacterium TaxID=2364212 RepID=A0A2M8QED9_9CHLR|nr:MAG: hypothetical protein CUN48_05015 [Candidatus Thermofonsia Clade 3 bacterium]RMG62021.1 MAG: hypothetical protein D6709_13060 [Chloroflexota bacterium]
MARIEAALKDWRKPAAAAPAEARERKAPLPGCCRKRARLEEVVAGRAPPIIARSSLSARHCATKG